MPLFPWITTTDEGTTEYASEAMIHSWAHPLYDAFAEYGIDDYFNQEGMSEVFGMLSQITGLSASLNLISFSFWIAILCAVFALFGLAVYKLDKRYNKLSHVFLLLGCLSLLPGILVLIGHLQFILQLGALSGGESLGYSALLLGAPSFAFSNAYYGYNYLPLLLGIGILIVSLVYIKTVISPSLAALKQQPSAVQPSKKTRKTNQKTTKKNG
jgi:hypothetical protein